MGSLKDQLQQAGFAASPGALEPDEPDDEQAPTGIVYARKVVVRHSRKGRGGKTVTLIDGVRHGHEELLSDLKKGLGVGGAVEGDRIMLQGDQVDRAVAWFEKQEAIARVVRGT